MLAHENKRNQQMQRWAARLQVSALLVSSLFISFPATFMGKPTELKKKIKRATLKKKCGSGNWGQFHTRQWVLNKKKKSNPMPADLLHFDIKQVLDGRIWCEHVQTFIAALFTHRFWSMPNMPNVDIFYKQDRTFSLLSSSYSYSSSAL